MTADRDDIRDQALASLLKIKDSDIRISTLRQGYAAVDKGIHFGGAFSAIVPMVSLFYGGFIDIDVDDPTRAGQDLFVLSKGHAVAAMASIYADLGYFDPDVLNGSRSAESILNGHPGPILPGVQVATGPLGQGLAVAQGFAIAGQSSPSFDVFCVTGDGELQEGVVWEAFMHAPQRGLDNLCVLVDKNEGQLDDHLKLAFSMKNLPRQIESFGWRVFDVDGTDYPAVIRSLDIFRRQHRDGRPTAIICNTRKGFGAFNDALYKHKVTLSSEVFEQELSLQQAERDARVAEFAELYRQLTASTSGERRVAIDALARQMGFDLKTNGSIVATPAKRRSGKVPTRDKRIAYDPDSLPNYTVGDSVMANAVIADCFKIFARDPRIVSVDSDLSSTSGLAAGVGHVDPKRGINVGIAEANMMCIGEAFAALGNNAWVSTFCPFFNWNVIRRIAVGEQERREAIESESGWLSDGHGLDLTFLATAPNLDTGVNGATHMGNDDVAVIRTVAGLKIIDVSCPNLLVAALKWIMEGDRGLVYLRITRAASRALHGPDVEFEYGKAIGLNGSMDADVHLISSGRGVEEIAGTAEILESFGVSASVINMPSFDAALMSELIESGSRIVLAEQNNGLLLSELGDLLLRTKSSVDLEKILAINTRRDDGSLQFVHSATYPQLIRRFGLHAEQIAVRAKESLQI